MNEYAQVRDLEMQAVAPYQGTGIRGYQPVRVGGVRCRRNPVPEKQASSQRKSTDIMFLRFGADKVGTSVQGLNFGRKRYETLFDPIFPGTVFSSDGRGI